MCERGILKLEVSSNRLDKGCTISHIMEEGTNKQRGLGSALKTLKETAKSLFAMRYIKTEVDS